MATVWHPIKYSAMYRKHLALGATMTDFYGWQVASHFTSPEGEVQRMQQSVGLADISWLVKLDMKGNDTNPKSQILNSRSVWRLARGHWLVVCEPEAKDTVIQEMQTTESQNSCMHVTDVTSVYAAMLLAGPKSRYVLNKLTDLDVSEAAMLNLSCAQTGLAHVPAIILRQDLRPDIGDGNLLSYRLLIGRECGEYVWDAIMHAGQEYSIVPFGLTAQGLLGII